MSERPERAIRILLADASRITTMGIRQVIEKEADMEIVGVASDGEEAVAKTNELEPDVLIIEVDLPRLGGIKATQRVRRELPAVGVVILTAQDQEQILFEAIRAGAAAYLHKDCEPTELTDAIRKVRNGQFIINEKIFSRPAEVRELDLLIESTQTEVNRLRFREDQLKTKVEEVRQNPANHQREEIFSTTDEFNVAMSRRMTMEGQLGALVAKRKLIDRSAQILNSTQRTLAEYSAPALPADATPLIDESRLLQAVVDTQEEERKRIARQVHDGPAQAMANVVLQSEISERLFDVDAQKSRGELASLRQMVNKTLQELRGFIFELRPMILDDLGLVPTLRRYVQTVKIPIRTAPQLVT